MVAVYNMRDMVNINTWDLSREGKTPRDIGIEPMLETPIRLEIGQVLIIEGVAYSVVTISSRANIQMSAYVNKLPLQDVFVNGHVPEPTYYNPELKCPFCGSVFEDTFEMDNSDSNYECPVCESVFAYESSITVNYHITPIKKSETHTFSYSKEETERTESCD